MELEELKQLVELIQADAAAIIHHQTVLANVKSQLLENQRRPFEQDFIYADHFGNKPSEPREQVIDGVKITTQVLHQAGPGLRDIAGADLLYEIEDEKYALIQYKRPNAKGLVQNDKTQLNALLENCPSVCMYKSLNSLFQPLRLNGYCGCWYNCITSSGARYLHACEASLLFRDKKSTSQNNFLSGLTKDEFDRLFAVCKIGALVSTQRPSHYIEHQLIHRHLVFHLVQHGRW